jgi:hypothetical protein
MHWEKKDSLGSTNGAGKTGYLHAEDLTPDLCLSSYTKIHSKWIKDLNVRFETTVGKTLKDTDIGNYFLNRTPIAQDLRARISK